MKPISNIKYQISKKEFTLISKACKGFSLKSVAFKGFTLIEILVVISIIGILATLILARLGSAEKAGRDARRRSDLNQYRTALENYALKNNSMYPYYYNGVEPCLAVISPYMGACPQDPRYDVATGYRYLYKSSVTDGQYFILWAKMENYSTDTYYYVCSNGKIGTAATIGTSLCGF